MKISATIITYNEERNIARAIESLRCADEILVVDSGSSDRTVAIAGKLGARILDRNWIGYADQKNWAADQAKHAQPSHLVHPDEQCSGNRSRPLPRDSSKPVHRLHRFSADSQLP